MSTRLHSGSTRPLAVLTANLLHTLLDYDPETGVFKWLEHRGRVKAGDIAGTCDHDTSAIRINRRRYRASHLAVLWMTGKWPDGEINHRDGDGTNTRWANLKPVGRSEKLYNRGKQRNNSAGFKGVTFHQGRGRFLAHIQAAGDRRYLGYFDTAERAHAAYCRAAHDMHGRYARTS
jgi:hypothetical protein